VISPNQLVITLAVAYLLQELAETNAGLERAVADCTAKLAQVVQNTKDLDYSTVSAGGAFQNPNKTAQ
jgi:hypothetical protein